MENRKLILYEVKGRVAIITIDRPAAFFFFLLQ